MDRELWNKNGYKAVVIGTSTGGIEALKIILSALPKNFPLPVIIVQHLSPHSDNYMVKYLAGVCSLKVKEAEEKETICGGYAYIAPPNYHLLVEKNMTLSLSVDPKVNYARPSIDVLFDSAADVFKDRLIGVILTGANSDGSLGLKNIKESGGIAIVQDPETAQSDSMPKAAIGIINADYVLSLDDISTKLIELAGGER